MICQSCHAVIPPGLAHIRTSMFRQLAWCSPCWVARPAIPAQRVAADERVAR